jgi:hypothetical protein
MSVLYRYVGLLQFTAFSVVFIHILDANLISFFKFTQLCCQRVLASAVHILKLERYRED